jgi:hypothetical protein
VTTVTAGLGAGGGGECLEQALDIANNAASNHSSNAAWMMRPEV